MAASYVVNITINAGATFNQSFTLESDGIPLNLSNYTLDSQLRKHPQSNSYTSFTATKISPSTGVMQIKLTSGTTSTLKPGRYVYDIIITNNSNGEKTRVIEGTAMVTQNVTRI